MIERLGEWRRKRLRAADWKRVSTQIKEDAEHRRELLVGQEHHVAWLEALLFRIDPIRINFEDNTDEYRAEAETITLRRAEAETPADVRRIVHEEFVRWFDPSTAGPPSRYDAIATETWDRWHAEEPR